MELVPPWVTAPDVGASRGHFSDSQSSLSTTYCPSKRSGKIPLEQAAMAASGSAWKRNSPQRSLSRTLSVREPPPIELRALEVELGVRPVLRERDLFPSGELVETVPADPEVVGRS